MNFQKFIEERRQDIIIDKEQVSCSRLSRIFRQGDYFVDCFSCKNYEGESTRFCTKFKQELPPELIDLGCGQGAEDIPF